MKEGIDYEAIKTKDSDGNVIKVQIKMLDKKKTTANKPQEKAKAK